MQDNTISGIQEWLDKRGIMPVFITTILALMLRSAQTWSFGGFSIARLPQPIPTILVMATGVAVALAAELLASIAGRAWLTGWQEVVAIMTNRAIPKGQRGQEAALQRFKNKINFAFLLFGEAISIYGGVNFALTVSSDNALLDVIITVAIVGIVFYLGVVYTPHQKSHREYALDMSRGIKAEIVKTNADKIKSGDYDNRIVQSVMASLPAHEQGELRALLQSDRADEEMWDSATIATWIGREDEAGRKYIARLLAKAFTNGDTTIQRGGGNGRGYRAPVSTVFRLFGEEILTERGKTSAGHGAPKVLAFPGVFPPAMGQE